MAYKEKVVLNTAFSKKTPSSVTEDSLLFLRDGQMSEGEGFVQIKQHAAVLSAYDGYVVASSTNILKTLERRGFVEPAVLSFAVDDAKDAGRFFRGAQRYRRDKFSVRGGVVRLKQDTEGESTFIAYELHNQLLVPPPLNREMRELLKKDYAPFTLDFAKRTGKGIEGLVVHWNGLVEFVGETQISPDEMMDSYAQVLKDFNVKVLPNPELKLQEKGFSSDMIQLYRVLNWSGRMPVSV